GLLFRGLGFVLGRWGILCLFLCLDRFFLGLFRHFHGLLDLALCLGHFLRCDRNERGCGFHGFHGFHGLFHGLFHPWSCGLASIAGEEGDRIALDVCRFGGLIQFGCCALDQSVAVVRQVCDKFGKFLVGHRGFATLNKCEELAVCFHLCRWTHGGFGKGKQRRGFHQITRRVHVIRKVVLCPLFKPL